MGQTRMFRDRVVSMEQTLEGGEKHLPVLKDLCREALPELEFREHTLDHERDLFVMEFVAAGGARTRICWTRMVLFDAERIPTLAGDPASALRTKIVDLLRSKKSEPEILVTFRHLEDGWVDTPEPRREGRRRRRGGRGGSRGPERGPSEKRPGGSRERRPGQPPGAPSQRPAGPRAAGPASRPAGSGPAPPRPSAAQGGAPGEPGAPAPGGKRRRRFRRRRRGRGGAAGPSSPAGPSSSGTPSP
ncbi:MAG: hypothetical protein ABI968_03135 [Acidobacteriota bacterium]